MNFIKDTSSTGQEEAQLTIAVLGVNHNTAPINIREALAFTPSESSDFLRKCRSVGLIRGGVLLSTCNRMCMFVESTLPAGELYEHLSRFVLEYKRLPNTHRVHFAFDTGDEAIHHLFYLASGYLSMVRGETQILGQIKEAVQVARSSGNSTNTLLRLFDKAYEAAKKIRSTQQVFAVNRSAGAAAVELLVEHQGVDALRSRKHLILGAGQMAVTLVESLKSHAVNDVRLYNRTEERAIRFAEAYGIAEAYSEDELEEAINGVHYIWVATSASSPIIDRSTLVETTGELFIFDLGLPRNVAEDVGTVKGVKLYCIDDLQDETKAVSYVIPDEVHTIVTEMTDEYYSWLKSRQIKDVFAIIKEDMEGHFENELNKCEGLDAHERELIEEYNKQLMKAYSTSIISRLRRVVEETHDPIYADAIKKILMI